MSTSPAVFEGRFTDSPSVPEAAIERAVAVLRTGRLHRYTLADGEEPEATALEREFAAYTGAPYCLALASGGYAIQTALRALGLPAGARVLANAFTLSPVPGAIVAAGLAPVLVETTDQLVIDLDDLERQAQRTGARVLLLSHMRGHLIDMDALMERAEALSLTVVEDCAHTMGARWNGVPSGRHGRVACYSTQTYKHINSGEGGLLTSNDPDLVARATVLSGSYMLYERHGAGPPAAAFDAVRLDTPNCSGRMDNLRAAILRPQLAALDAAVARWNDNYRALEASLGGFAGIERIARPAPGEFVGSSLQFRAPALAVHGVDRFLATARERGAELKWFGADAPAGYTSRFDSWRFVEQRDLPATRAALARLFDVRISLTFTPDDCALLGRVIGESLEHALG